MHSFNYSNSYLHLLQGVIFIGFSGQFRVELVFRVPLEALVKEIDNKRIDDRLFDRYIEKWIAGRETEKTETENKG